MARTKTDPISKERGQTFSKKLRIERERRSLTQRRLSEMSDVPLDTLRSIESGRILCPGIFVAIDLVHALGGNVSEWFKPNTRKKDG